ncbi:MAG: hypothetical protein WC869_06385 [Phycisphaerae bacterium]|jgi:hypothetical protein
MLHTVLIVVLTAALAGAVVSFGLAGLRQSRRTVALARAAHEEGMLFSAEDLFDVPVRYGGFILTRCGHSQRANNITYGRMGGLPVRAFDFRYEIGHGTRRVSRHYGVIVVETAAVLPPLTMWNRDDADYAPLAARHCEGQAGSWCYQGDAAMARAAAAACEGLGASAVSLQTRGSALMLCSPQPRKGYGGNWRQIAGLLKAMGQAAAPDAAADRREGDVETPAEKC